MLRTTYDKDQHRHRWDLTVPCQKSPASLDPTRMWKFIQHRKIVSGVLKVPGVKNWSTMQDFRYTLEISQNYWKCAFISTSEGTRSMPYASWKLDKASISVNRGSHLQVHFVWQVWDGQLSPSSKTIRYVKSSRRVELPPGYDKAPC